MQLVAFLQSGLCLTFKDSEMEFKIPITFCIFNIMLLVSNVRDVKSVHHECLVNHGPLCLPIQPSRQLLLTSLKEVLLSLAYVLTWLAATQLVMSGYTLNNIYKM